MSAAGAALLLAACAGGDHASPTEPTAQPTGPSVAADTARPTPPTPPAPTSASLGGVVGLTWAGWADTARVDTLAAGDTLTRVAAAVDSASRPVAGAVVVYAGLAAADAAAGTPQPVRVDAGSGFARATALGAGSVRATAAGRTGPVVVGWKTLVLPRVAAAAFADVALAPGGTARPALVAQDSTGADVALRVNSAVGPGVGAGVPVAFATTDSAVATVAADGTVRAVAPGVTTVMAVLAQGRRVVRVDGRVTVTAPAAPTAPTPTAPTPTAPTPTAPTPTAPTPTAPTPTAPTPTAPTPTAPTPTVPTPLAPTPAAPTPAAPAPAAPAPAAPAPAAPAPVTPTPSTPTPPAAGGSGGFRIDVRYVGTPDPRIADLVERAARSWEAVIVAGGPAVTRLTLAAGECGRGTPALDEAVPSVVVYVAIDALDGPGGRAGTAGPCVLRSETTAEGTRYGLPVAGYLGYDRDDLLPMVTNGSAYDMLRHQLGHVLGIGTVWNLAGQRALVTDGYDYVGAGASAASAALGYTPVGSAALAEDLGGPGTVGSHWRESVYGDELMTSYVAAGAPMTRVTVASLADIGYTVVAGAGEPRALLARAAARSGALRAARSPAPTAGASTGRETVLVPRLTVSRRGVRAQVRARVR